ncbi:MAG: hypothetical protein WAM53_18255 [Terrimicrobiaceae bacterium]
MKKNLEKLKLLSRDLRDGRQYPRSPFNLEKLDEGEGRAIVRTSSFHEGR